jgi:hypothetical protein
MSSYYKSKRPALLGDDKASDDRPSLSGLISSPAVKTASAVALTYHGYRRTGSILWALFYGLVGRTVPVVAVPIAAAQGFGKKRTCTTEP